MWNVLKLNAEEVQKKMQTSGPSLKRQAEFHVEKKRLKEKTTP